MSRQGLNGNKRKNDPCEKENERIMKLFNDVDTDELSADSEKPETSSDSESLSSESEQDPYKDCDGSDTTYIPNEDSLSSTTHISDSEEDNVSAIDFRIIGGLHAPEEYGRFHASVQNLTGHHVCGGAVVSQWFVVSAAHCVHKANPRFMKIVAGTNNLDVGGKRCDVSRIIVHRRYNSTSRQHDIALLKTKSPFDLEIIKPLRLSKRELHEGDEIVLVGFGASEPHGSSSRIMYTLEMPVFNQEICEYAMRYSRPVTKEMFCTFTQIGQGTCHGDSGSPLVIGNELVGIVSWGIPCAVGFPDVHTRLAPYVDWIKMHIREGYCGAPKRHFFIQSNVNNQQ